jgi:NADPH:quinone reductase-like Zn-dependent oxidoreductase
MKAAVHDRYGPPDVVRIADTEKPVPGENEVLIKVRAASVNPLDWHGMRGSPYVMRIMGGLRCPKDNRLGFDVAGQVEAVGGQVTDFKPGDEVFGMCKGAFAEYVCMSESGLSTLAIKPKNLTFEQAAAVPVAAFTALQALRDKAHIQPGQRVLIHGAAGGVGTFAVQIAKSFGAHVTGVCSTRNLSMVRSLGADEVIDYTREDFTRGQRQYEVLLDCVGNHSLAACRSVLVRRGTLIVVTGQGGQWLGPLARILKALLLSCLVSQKLVAFIARANTADLATLRELIEARKVTPVIDRCYKLSEVADAIRYLEEGHARGKVVIALDN